MPAWSIPIQQGGGWKLRVLSGTSLGKEFDLVPARYVLGSKAPATIVIPDPSIAPQHVVLEISADRVQLRDCSGGAGVMVNGARIASAQVAPGDQIAVGNFRFTFSNPNWRPAAVPLSPTGAPAARSAFDRFAKLPLWLRAGAVTFVVASVLFVLFVLTKAVTLVPVMLISMSAVVPTAVICWLVEKYDRTGLSFHTLALTFLAGGTVGVICAMVVYVLAGSLLAVAMFAGVAEEPGKFLATAWRWRHRVYDRPMDGLIIGTVAGFGFAVVETAGYGLDALIQGGKADLLWTMAFRSLTAPFCHGLWAGMVAAAFWQVGRNLKLAIRSRVFWVAAAWAVGLHALWNGSAMLTEMDSERLDCLTVGCIGLGYVLMIGTAVLSAWQYRGLLLNNGYRR
ncbi:MAG TPA: PrsW family glutamic-type intramembrane protease [Gemmataceae bacterium]|nr:PrsW family glutamic-type intramembrane protease [Gemmataceae bacterium]